MKLNDDGKLRQRFCNKRVNARKEGIEFSLTFEEFCSLLVEAKVVSSQLGIKGYHLARNNDHGSYTIGNCSFVHYKINYAQKKVSEKARMASSINARKALAAIQSTPMKTRSAWGRKGGIASQRKKRVGGSKPLS